MLGFGIGEIILIVIVAIIVLGPDKLPNALIEMAKFIRVVKKTMQDAKETLDREVNLAEIKREAQAYKEKLEQSADISKDIKDANLIDEIQKDMNDIQHLFKDYKPKPIDISTQTQQEEKTTTKDSLEMDNGKQNTLKESNGLIDSATYNDSTNNSLENLDSKTAHKKANANGK